MAGNSFGDLFRISTYGESHGPGLGVIIDGCPANLVIDEDLIRFDLQRRKPGQSAIVTQRKEEENFVIHSGVFEGKTTGMPIHIFIPNSNQKSQDYEHIKDTFRPSHADYTYAQKYGHRDYRGGGRSSARETVARVAAGAIAKMYLKLHQITIHAWVDQVGSISIPKGTNIDPSLTDTNIVRCPDPETAEQMESLIRTIKKNGDTIGGAITCIVIGCPPGLGEPVFDKLHADLGKAMLSINAVKGFEIGSGFRAIEMLGSEHNDLFDFRNSERPTISNHSGGIQGGISNGMPIQCRVAFKPVATIMQDQSITNAEGEEHIIQGKGRHDPCVVPRAVPIVEAMAALTIADHLLKWKISR